MSEYIEFNARRDALKIAGMGAAVGALALLTRTGHAADKPAMTAQDPMAKTDSGMGKMAAPAGGDLDIVRFALTMERLEAAFYAQVLTAHKTRAFLPARSFALAQEIAVAEADHVGALEGVLTAAGAEIPATPKFQFPGEVFISPIAYAWFAHTIEEIGVGAYLGAVGNIQNDGLRRSAAAIYGAEARHVAILRTLAGFNFSPRYFESPLSVDQVTKLITPYIVA